MSCRRKQEVLRLPMSTVGVVTEEQWERFEAEHEDVLDWEVGCFCPALCTKRHGYYLDYYLVDEAPYRGERDEWSARPLTEAEKRQYLGTFRSLFPDFTSEQMEAVHHCVYDWYDGTDAPELY